MKHDVAARCRPLNNSPDNLWAVRFFLPQERNVSQMRRIYVMFHIYTDKQGNKFILAAYWRHRDGTVEYPAPGKRALRVYLPKRVK